MPEKESSTCKRFAIIACEDGEKWGGEKGICDSLIEIFRNKQNIDDGVCHEWISIHAVTGELPSIDEMKQLDGIIMTGSRHSANDDKPWVDNLAQFVRDIREIQRMNDEKPKIVGLCFSHQLIAKSLGGKVASNPAGKFVLIAETMKIEEELARKSYFKEAIPAERKEFVLLESHGEAVTELAANSRCVASSPTCTNEIILYDEDTITIQAHPELLVHDIEKNIVPAMKSRKLLTDEDIVHTHKTFEMSLDSASVILMIQKFIGIL